VKSDRTSNRHRAGIETGYVRFGFPNSYLEKTKGLLDHILGIEPSDPETNTKRIYLWMVQNLSYANAPPALPDYSILDTGIGTCVQLTRLFANLLYLLGIPVREQCGALMGRPNSGWETITISRGYSPFVHTWAEVYLEQRGWVPVDFIVMGYCERQANDINVDLDLRSELTAQSPVLTEYYFGNLDPYRVYANRYHNRIPPLMSARAENFRVPREFLLHLHHRLSCSLSAPAGIVDQGPFVDLEDEPPAPDAGTRTQKAKN
jgi:hypothetical protein